MKKLNSNLYPKDGHFFVERDGARIFADSWKGVFKRVLGYRQRAGYPIGNVEEEVIAQACARNPVICSEDSAAYVKEVSRASLKSRVLQWFMKRQAEKQSEPFVFVPDDERNNRVNTCAACPNNQGLPEGCASCKAAVKEARGSIIGPRAVDARLNSCSVLGEELNTSVWLDRLRVEEPDLPAHCWRKRQV
jgi:hypothetical protein